MKEIKAVIKPFKLQQVIDALRNIEGLPGITISAAHSLSAEHGTFDQFAKTKLEVMVPEGLVETVVEAIRSAAHTGNPGDGRIFVIPVEQTVKISTGERDKHA